MTQAVTLANAGVQGSAKAWVRFTGSTGGVLASYNVSSVTRSTTGQYAINFTNAFADANYSCTLATPQSSNGTNYVYVNYSTLTASAANILMTPSGSGGGGLTDPATVSASFFR
jgi:hypothetical protein